MIKLSKRVCVIAALFASSSALAADSGWSISEADGQVSVMRGDKPLYGAAGTRLQIGDVVRTAKGARAVLVREDEYLIVSPLEQARITKAQESGVVAQLIDTLGGMLFDNKNTQSQKSLQGPMNAAVTKGFGKEKKTP